MIYLFEIIKENAAIIVAVLALLLTVWQGMEIRKHNRLSMRPLLNISWYDGWHDARDDGMIRGELKISNNGLGLAIIKKVVLFYEGKEISYNNNETYCEFLLELTKGYNARIGFIMPDAIIKADEHEILWTLEHHPKNDNIDFIHKLSLLIEYQSIYENKTFVLDGRDLSKSKI
ncbi:MAG: hypothetical protein ACNYPD_04735 [Candidatus Halichondribacter symbioticus]